MTTYAPSAPAADQPRICYLDTWRLLAVSLVILSHTITYGHPWFKQIMPGMVWRISGLGTYGVLIFFCISGFVICRGMIRERAVSGAVSMKGFYTRRVLRIVPPLALYLLAVALLVAGDLVQVRDNDLLKAATFVCNIKALSACGWYVGHTWSLAFEEQFYLVFPLIFAALLLRDRRAVLFLTGAFMAMSMLLCAIGHRLVADALTMFTFMLCGCSAALYFGECMQLTRRVSALPWALTAIVTPIIAYWIVLPELLHHALMTLVLPPAICIILLRTPPRDHWIGAWFNDPRAAYLGKITFTVYLWQQIPTCHYSWSTPWSALPGVLLVFLWAHISFKYIETPLIQLGARLSHNQPPAALTALGSTP